MYYRYVPQAHRGGFSLSPLTFQFLFLQVFNWVHFTLYLYVRNMSYTLQGAHTIKVLSQNSHDYPYLKMKKCVCVCYLLLKKENCYVWTKF